MLEILDLEGCVEAVYSIGGYDDDEIDTPLRIAKRLFGPGSISRSRNMIALGSSGLLGAELRIVVRAGLPREREQHVIGHEIGHWILRRLGHHTTSHDTELECDFIGAAIMTRRQVFACAAHSREKEFAQLAFDFGATETLIALRVGEVTGIPIAVVAPHAVRARGRAEWPDEQRVREFARKGVRGLSRVRLTDDRRRVALVGEEEIDAA